MISFFYCNAVFPYAGNHIFLDSAPFAEGIPSIRLSLLNHVRSWIKYNLINYVQRSYITSLLFRFIRTCHCLMAKLKLNIASLKANARALAGVTSGSWCTTLNTNFILRSTFTTASAFLFPFKKYLSSFSDLKLHKTTKL